MNLSIIIPIDVFEESLFTRAYNSIEKGHEIIVVGPKTEVEKAKALFSDIIMLENEDINLPKQINKAVDAVTSEYFTILEYDDVFTNNWFTSLTNYSKAHENYFAYLPIYEVYDFNNMDKEAIGYINEPVWASSFSEKLGYFDNESLQHYLNIGCSGAAFKKDDYLEIGGLKESIKLTFWYEMLLRAVYKEKTIYVIPKIGYEHTVNRPNSLLEQYNTNMSQNEADWWINLAKEEYCFKRDRNKKYEE